MKTVSAFVALDDLAGVGVDMASTLAASLSIMPMMVMVLLVTVYALIAL